MKMKTLNVYYEMNEWNGHEATTIRSMHCRRLISFVSFLALCFCFVPFVLAALPCRSIWMARSLIFCREPFSLNAHFSCDFSTKTVLERCFGHFEASIASVWRDSWCVLRSIHSIRCPHLRSIVVYSIYDWFFPFLTVHFVTPSVRGTVCTRHLISPVFSIPIHFNRFVCYIKYLLIIKFEW